MTDQQNRDNDVDLKTPDDLARLYQKSRVEMPETLRAEIEAQAFAMLDEKPATPRTSPRTQRRWNLLAGMALAASLVITVFVAGYWRDFLAQAPNDPEPVSDMGDLLLVRGGAWEQAIALRQRLVIEHPELAQDLSADEQRAWESSVQQDCKGAQACLDQWSRERLKYLNEAYAWPADPSLPGSYRNAGYGVVEISFLPSSADVIRYRIDAQRPDNGHVGMVSGIAHLEGGTYVTTPKKGGVQSCVVHLVPNKRVLEVTVSGCSEDVGTGVVLGGTYRKLGQQPGSP